MTHYTPPTTTINNIKELHTFIQWYFQNVKQLSIPGQITKYIHNNKIKTWKPLTPRQILVILTQHDEYGTDTRNKRRRYYLKGEYGTIHPHTIIEMNNKVGEDITL